MNIDEVLTLFRKFSFLLNCLLYEVVRPLILIRKHNFGSLIALKYIILRTGSGLKLLFLAKMAFSVIFVFFERLLVWGYITPLINQKTVMVSFRSTLSNTGSDNNSLFFSERDFFKTNFTSWTTYVQFWSFWTPHFDRETQVMEVIVLKYSILIIGSCLKFLFLIYSGHSDKV